MRQPHESAPTTRRGDAGFHLALSLVCAVTLGGVAGGCSTSESAPRGVGQESSAPAAESSSATPAPKELLPNGVLAEDDLLAGGQPSVEQLAELAKAGYATVINLRTDGEGGTDREDVEALGMTYVSLPVAGADGMSEENARALAAILEEVGRPVVVHCGSGNRVGGLLALKAFYVDGASVDEAMRYGLDSGLTGLESTVRERLEAASEASEADADG